MERELKNIKRSLLRLEDKIYGNDMGYWFCDRVNLVDSLKDIKTIEEVFSCVNAEIENAEEWWEDEYKEKVIKLCNAWINRRKAILARKIA